MTVPRTRAPKGSIRVQLPVFALPSVLLSAFALSGCAAIGDIFKAGVWVGVLVIVGLLALVGGGMALLRR